MSTALDKIWLLRGSQGKWAVTGDIKFKGRGVSLTVLEPEQTANGKTQIELSSQDDTNIIDTIRDHTVELVNKASGCVESLDDVRPTSSKGDIYLNMADSCMSWSTTNGLDNRGIPWENEGQSLNLEGELWIFDTCPPCAGDCPKVMQYKLILEQIKMLYWQLKDINLYTADIVAKRLDYAQKASLKGRDDRIPENCASISPDMQEYPNISSGFVATMDRLMGQYLTLIHMWNFVVQGAPHKTEFKPLPDAVSGFAMQTTYARPTCDGATTVRCVILIEPVMIQDHVVVWIPEPAIALLPYANASANLSGTFTHNANKDGGTFVFEDLAGEAVGTYAITLKVYPYIPVIQYRSDDPEQRPISPDYYPGTPDRVVTRRGDGKYVIAYTGTGISSKIQDPSQDWTPSAEGYAQSLNYVSSNTVDKNIWRIRIAWTLSGNVEASHTDNFYYMAPAVRVPITTSRSNFSFVASGLGCFSETPTENLEDIGNTPPEIAEPSTVPDNPQDENNDHTVPDNPQDENNDDQDIVIF